MFPVLSQKHPVHIFPPSFPKIRSNIIFPPTSSSQSVCPFQVFKPNSCTLFSYLPCMIHAFPSDSPWFDHHNNIWLSIQAMKLLIMQSSPASRHFLPLSSSEPCYQTLSMYMFPVVWETKVSHPYKIRGKIVFSRVSKKLKIYFIISTFIVNIQKRNWYDFSTQRTGSSVSQVFFNSVRKKNVW
jgi:hypothetical protein